jgi:Zn finger protein HypA/HybF involved in hydrogenase expression
MPILPCKDCNTACKATLGRYQGRCPLCKDKRRTDGLNTFAYNCGCGKQVILQAKAIPSWDGMCPSCRQEHKLREGATLHTRHHNGRAYEVALFDHELPRDRFERQDVL